MSESMVERVARAICLAELPTDSKWELCVPAARAAIETMRNPPDEMMAAYFEEEMKRYVYEAPGISDAWKLMIDAALKD